MKEKPLLLKWLTDNSALKLISILIAVILWFLVTNINDPVISRAFYNVPVTIRNASVLSDAGQVYEVLEGTDQITTVTVTAQRSVVETFTRDNIQAVADMNDLTSRNTIPIHLSVNKNTNDVVSVEGSIEDVRLNVEDRKTRTVSLGVITVGVLAEGYMTGEVSPAQNLVRISGPASRVDAVSRAEAEIDVTGFTSDIGTEADIRLYDTDGNLIRDTGITQNITGVRVQVEILQTKTVPLRVRFTGTPADGYLTTGEAGVSPSEILIAGKAEIIEGITEIVLSGDDLNLAGRTDSLLLDVDVRKFLPAGTRLVDPEAGSQATVSAEVLPVVTHQTEVSVSRLTIENMPAEALYTVFPEGTETVTVTLTGLESEVSRVDPGAVSLYVDMESALAQYEEELPQLISVAAQVTVPDGVRVTGSASVNLRRE